MCIFLGVAFGVGAKERPLLKSSVSALVSSYVLKLCIVKSDVAVLSGLRLKNDARSSLLLPVGVPLLVFCFYSMVLMVVTLAQLKLLPHKLMLRMLL